MTRKELIAKMANAAGTTKTDAEKALNGFLSTVTGSLQQGEKVALPGFGTFSVRDRAARIGRNPRTGESIEIPARRVVKFRPGKKLSESISNR